MDIGDVGTEQFVLTSQFIHLVFKLAAAFLHTVEQTVRDAVLHPVELVLVRGVGQIHRTVSFPKQFLLVQFFDILAFTLDLIHLLPLGLFRKDTHRHDALDVGFWFLEPDPPAGLESCPFPIHFGT